MINFDILLYFCKPKSVLSFTSAENYIHVHWETNTKISEKYRLYVIPNERLIKFIQIFFFSGNET